MDHLTFRTLVVLASWLVAVWLGFRVWRSKDPLFFKVVLTGILLVPVIGPLVVYWISNFPSRLHSDVQARYPKQINSYGRGRTEDDEPESKDRKD